MFQDIAKVEASIDTFGKQMEVFRIDKERWMGRFKTNMIILEQLQNEVKENVSNNHQLISQLEKKLIICFFFTFLSQKNPIYGIYLSQKETERKNLDLTLKNEHLSKVLQFHTQETDRSRRTIELTGEILQDAYLALSSNLLLTDAMRDKLNQLYKSHDQRGVKFTDADDNLQSEFDLTTSTEQNQNEYVLDHDPLVHTMTDSSSTFNLKRGRSSGDVRNDNQPTTKKRAVRSIFETQNGNLNSTQVLETHDDLNTLDCNMDATFAIKPKKPALKSTEPLRPLKESNPNIHKDFVVPRPVTKPMTKIKSTLIGLHREKENKRTPSKVRRSPRRNSPSNALKSE